MTTNSGDRESVAARFRDRVVTRIAEYSGDRALAEEVGPFILDCARGLYEDPDATQRTWDRLEELAIELAVHRFRARRKERIPSALGELVADGQPPPEHAELVMAALKIVPARQRAVLEMIHVDGLDLDDAADFLEIDQASANRLLARGRQRLRREYRRLTGGLPAVFGIVFDAARRARAGLGRAQAAWTEGLAQWARLDPVRSIVVATTAAAGLSVAVVVAVSGGHGNPSVKPAMPSRPAPVIQGAQSAPDGPPEARGPGRPAVIPSSARRGPLVVERTIQSGPEGTQTKYRVVSRSTSDQQPGSEGGNLLTRVVVFDCPPPEVRTPVEAFGCPLVAP